VRTSNEDADTGWTTAGSVVITQARHHDWHGSGAFYDRQAALNARFPHRESAAKSQAAVLRQNYVGNLRRPIAKNKSGSSPHSKSVHEDASIAYSPASTIQFNALAH